MVKRVCNSYLNWLTVTWAAISVVYCLPTLNDFQCLELTCDITFSTISQFQQLSSDASTIGNNKKLK